MTSRMPSRLFVGRATRATEVHSALSVKPSSRVWSMKSENVKVSLQTSRLGYVPTPLKPSAWPSRGTTSASSPV